MESMRLQISSKNITIYITILMICKLVMRSNRDCALYNYSAVAADDSTRVFVSIRGSMYMSYLPFDG